MKYYNEKIKIGDLFKILSLDNSLYDKIQTSSFPIYIKNINNELVPILGYVKKRVNLVKYTFKDTNDNLLNLTCSDKHIVLDENGNNIFVKDTKYCQSMYNGILHKIKEEIIGIGDAYDISIKSPHLYYTSNGIIHHNTSYIRNLMYTLKGRRFIILDNSVFAYITDASFISLLLENKNSVIILEDCEAMLSDRLSGNNQLATLLNLSDGILGDSFNFKFICTFNANIAKLDKAILRKGRLKVKYEFKNLAADKTKALCEKIGKTCKDGESLSLADIFNYEEETGVKEERKIGFGK